jgi:hypothetical protein
MLCRPQGQDANYAGRSILQVYFGRTGRVGLTVLRFHSMNRLNQMSQTITLTTMRPLVPTIRSSCAAMLRAKALAKPADLRG